ncbi:MAG TPA: CAP domain-containing protein [Acidimicrobiales bacterium]|nr:CAP domain-containing protein [Acidimicrobiales bacterium]
MARRLHVGLALVLGTGVVGSIGMQAASADTASTAAAEFVQNINQLRASHGIGPLSVNSSLASVAYNWSVRMAQAGTISHNPNLASQAPSNWQMLGENVGMGPNEPTLQQAFTNSPEHYANMVNANFSEIGVGVVVTPNGTMFVTEDYMQPQASSAPAPAPVAAPAPAPAPALPHAYVPPVSVSHPVTVAPTHTASAAPPAPAAPAAAPAPPAAPHVAARPYAVNPKAVTHRLVSLAIADPTPVLPTGLHSPATVPAASTGPGAGLGLLAGAIAPGAVLAFLLRRRRRG